MSDRLRAARSSTDPDSGGGSSAPFIPQIYRRKQSRFVAAFTLVVLLGPLVVDGNYGHGLLQRWLILSIVTVGFYLAFAVGGQFAFSQASFMAIGGYSSAWVTQDGPAFVGLVVGIAAATIVGLGFALLMKNANQFFFAITTLAIGQLIIVVIKNWEAFGGTSAQRFNLPSFSVLGHELESNVEQYYLLLVVLVAALMLAVLIERSPLRRDAIANRDNEIVARAVGSPTLRSRVVMFAIGAGYAGAAGALLVHTGGFVAIELFSLDLGVQIFLIAIVGGLSSHWGAVLGAGLIVWIGELLRDAAEYRNLVYGVGLVVVMILLPEGILGGLTSSARRLAHGRAPSRLER